MAKVSVVIPVYKAERYLRQCLDSVTGQTLQDMEIIVVDDGSPDACPTICDEYAQRDSRVKVIHKPNGGVMAAVNTGIRAAAGDYVGFLDSDDWVDPGYFEELYTGAAQADADIAATGHVRHADGAEFEIFTRPAVVYDGSEAVRSLLSDYLISKLTKAPADRPLTNCRWDKLYRRTLLMANISYCSETLWLGEDTVMNVAALVDCTKFVTLTGTARYHYRILSASLSHTAENTLPGERELRNTEDYYKALLRIAEEKAQNPEAFLIYIGGDIYKGVYHCLKLRGVRRKEQRAVLRRFMSFAPPGAMEKYAATRNSAFIRLFCRMLELGLTDPCIWFVSLWEALSGQKP